MWGPPLSVVKIQPVKKKLHGEQKKLRAVDEEEICQGRLQVAPATVPAPSSLTAHPINFSDSY